MLGIMTFRRFGFEPDDLDLLPLDLRRKLDLAGRKLSLAAWRALSVGDRQALCEASETALASLDAPAILPRAPWREPAALERVAARAREIGVPFDPGRWATLDDSARHALHHLADPRREPERFLTAVAELVG
jgi:hypothetical protein